MTMVTLFRDHYIKNAEPIYVLKICYCSARDFANQDLFTVFTFLIELQATGNFAPSRSQVTGYKKNQTKKNL